MKNNHIDYIEFQATDLGVIKDFYSQVFGWKFTDYGPDYIAFDNSGLKGGFAKVEKVESKGTLVVLYHSDLEAVLDKVVRAGATIEKKIFSFPGGRRFHFRDPSSNELAIWSDK